MPCLASWLLKKTKSMALKLMADGSTVDPEVIRALSVALSANQAGDWSSDYNKEAQSYSGFNYIAIAAISRSRLERLAMSTTPKTTRPPPFARACSESTAQSGSPSRMMDSCNKGSSSENNHSYKANGQEWYSTAADATES